MLYNKSVQTLMTLSSIPYVKISSTSKSVVSTSTQTVPSVDSSPDSATHSWSSDHEQYTFQASHLMKQQTEMRSTSMNTTASITTKMNDRKLNMDITRNVMSEKKPFIETKLFHHPLRRLPKIAYDSTEEGETEPESTSHPTMCNLDVSRQQFLPHSPIIRSKYVRKQKVQLESYPERDHKTTKHIPKRFISNKRTPDITCKSRSSEEIRQRSRHESVASRPIRPDAVLVDFMARGKYGSQYSSPDENEGSIRSGSRTPKCGGSPSINRPTRSPVRKLKTAAELLNESKKNMSLPNRPRCHSMDVPCDGDRNRVSSGGVSDKGNKRYSDVSDESEPWVVIGESSGELHTSRSSSLQTVTHIQQSPPKSGHGPKSPRARRQLFTSREGYDKSTCTSAPRPECASIVWMSMKDDVEHSSPISETSISNSPSKTRSSPMSPSTMERRLYRLFGKHFHSPSALRSQNHGGRGALNTLCRNTLTVELDSSGGGEARYRSPPSSPGTHTGRESSDGITGRGRIRFLDKNWLQKPKKFFKF